VNERPILIVHPHDRTTFFLESVKRDLVTEFGNQIHYYSVKPNNNSHIDCLKRIRIHPNEGIIIFLGHGRSDKLFGAKSDGYNALLSQDFINENPESQYYNDDFINEKNVNVFRGKKVFCLACDSNSKISDYAIREGATAFLGFGNIPTSIDEMKYQKNVLGREFLDRLKGEVNYIIKRSLVYSLSTGRTFQGLLDILQLICNQRITDILIKEKHFAWRHLLANTVYSIRSEVTVKGERNLKLMN